MKLELDEDILKKTTKCRQDFACLSAEGECLCEVEDLINDTLCFVRATNCGFCDYKIFFGNTFICSCPARNEIYKRYKI